MLWGIVSSSAQQSGMISDVSDEIEEIYQVVQTNSAAVERSVDNSRELSDQAKRLNDMIGKFRIGD